VCIYIAEVGKNRESLRNSLLSRFSCVLGHLAYLYICIIHTSIYIYFTDTNPHMYICKYRCIYIHMYRCSCIPGQLPYLSIYLYIYIQFSHTHTHKYIYTYIYILCTIIHIYIDGAGSRGSYHIYLCIIHTRAHIYIHIHTCTLVYK